MKRRFLLFAGMLLFFNVPAFAENIAVIVNNDSPIFSVKASPELKDIKDIYMGKIRYWKSSMVKAVNLKEQTSIVKFIKEICGMSVHEYQSHWVSLTLDTGIDSPRAFETPREVISFVLREKLSIGYVPESLVKDLEGVKIIAVIKE